MIVVDTKIRIERDISDVFAYVANPEKLPEWNSAVTDVRPDNHSAYVMTRHLPTGTVTNELHVVTFEPRLGSRSRRRRGPHRSTTSSGSTRTMTQRHWNCTRAPTSDRWRTCSARSHDAHSKAASRPTSKHSKPSSIPERHGESPAHDGAGDREPVLVANAEEVALARAVEDQDRIQDARIARRTRPG